MPILHSALASGISRGFSVAAVIMLGAVLITLAMVRVRRADLAGADNTATAVTVTAQDPKAS
jgi:isopentenyl diphosphate isomerase/L-lactate dehydrogenase-like FMN-dependent dehydrogenase